MKRSHSFGVVWAQDKRPDDIGNQTPGGQSRPSLDGPVRKDRPSDILFTRILQRHGRIFDGNERLMKIVEV